MDEELLLLRSRSYEAGLKHDRALITCNDVMSEGDYSASQRAVAQHEAAASEYRAALFMLIEYCGSLEQTGAITEEMERINRLLQLLDDHTHAIQHRLSALKMSDSKSVQ